MEDTLRSLVNQKPQTIPGDSHSVGDALPQPTEHVLSIPAVRSERPSLADKDDGVDGMGAISVADEHGSGFFGPFSEPKYFSG